MPWAKPSHLTYDLNHSVPTSVINKRKFKTDYFYDTKGNLTKWWMP